MEKNKLIKILEDLKEVRTESRTKVSDEILFDCSVRIYNSEQIETHRQGQKPIAKNPISTFSPATQSQIGLLKRLGYKKDTSKLTKQEASRLIDELK